MYNVSIGRYVTKTPTTGVKVRETENCGWLVDDELYDLFSDLYPGVVAGDEQTIYETLEADGRAKLDAIHAEYAALSAANGTPVLAREDIDVEANDSKPTGNPENPWQEKPAEDKRVFLHLIRLENGTPVGVLGRTADPSDAPNNYVMLDCTATPAASHE